MAKESKVVSLPVLKRRIAALRARGKIIAFTNGCFDILHYGHVSYLKAAKKNDRILVVGLNSDDSIRRLKGPDRPIHAQKYRAEVLAALECVDLVTVFHEDTPYNLIAAIKPDVLIKGADWKGKEIVGSDIVKKNGGRVELIQYVRDFSTTGIAAKIRTCG